jgi:multicomponent Na+:H+ antiporter subunit F
MSPGIDWMLGMLGVSLVLVFVRLARGSSLADRVVALDLLAVIGLSVLALFSLKYGQPAFLDVAILLGLVGFISAVAFARAMEAPRSRKDTDTPVGENHRLTDHADRKEGP